MNRKEKIIVTVIAFLLFTSCSSNENKKTFSNSENTISLTTEQSVIQKRLQRKIAKLGVTRLDTDEVIKISEEIAKCSLNSPEDLLPMLSYYEYYNDKLGVHYDLERWTELRFHKRPVELQYVNYPFYLMNQNTLFSWALVADSDNDSLRTDKIGGIVSFASTSLSCVEGLNVKFYLDNKSVVLHEVEDKFNCKPSNGMGCSIEYSKIERLAKSELKAIEIIDDRSSKVITMSVTNKYMRTYFIRLKELIDTHSLERVMK